MKKVSIIVKTDEDIVDFEGFVGNECSKEENEIRLLLGKMGVTTDVKYSDNKRDGEIEGVVERERNKN